MDIQAFGGFHGHSGLIQVVGRGGLRRRGRCRGRPSGAAAHPAGEPSHAGHPTCKVCWVTLPLSLQGGPSVPGKDYVYQPGGILSNITLQIQKSPFFINPKYYKTELQIWCQRNVFPEQMGYPEVPLLLGQSDSSAEWLT